MATTSADLPPQADRAVTYASEEGHGWVTFAGIMLAVVGTLNLIYGIGAIDDAHVYGAGDTAYVFGDLNTWGWFMLIVGIVQVLAAFSIWNRTSWGRWVGLVTASVNSMLMLLFMPAFPLLALALFGV